METEPNKSAANVATVSVGCSKCGASLPEGAQFCLKCGKPVSSTRKSPTLEGGAVLQTQPKPRHPRRTRRYILWSLLILLLLFLGWAITSDNPFAQAMQELAGWKHDRTLLETETPFVVGEHSFRRYKFDLPEGSTHVTIMGQFSSSSVTTGKDKNNKGKGGDGEIDNNIEVYVMSEPAFAVWQNGYATSSVYESGRVTQGTLQAELPAGAGIYYLIFSNKFSTNTAKNVNASILLRYKSWVPGWFRSLKERFVNWTGF